MRPFGAQPKQNPAAMLQPRHGFARRSYHSAQDIAYASRTGCRRNDLVVARRGLIRDAVDRAFSGARGRAGHRFDHVPRALGIGDPVLVEIIRASRNAARAFAGIDHAGIAAGNKLVDMVLRLTGTARVTDQVLRQLRVLDAVLFLPALTERAAVEADDRGVTEVGIDAVK